jgi:hypothetical protein
LEITDILIIGYVDATPFEDLIQNMVSIDEVDNAQMGDLGTYFHNQITCNDPSLHYDGYFIKASVMYLFCILITYFCKL